MEYKKDQRFLCNLTIGGRKQLRILAIEQNHIMCRFKGRVPFVKSVKEFAKYLENIGATEIITKNK